MVAVLLRRMPASNKKAMSTTVDKINIDAIKMVISKSFLENKKSVWSWIAFALRFDRFLSCFVILFYRFRMALKKGVTPSWFCVCVQASSVWIFYPNKSMRRGFPLLQVKTLQRLVDSEFVSHKSFLHLIFGAKDGTWTHTRKSLLAPQASASAIPPPSQLCLIV